MSQNFFVFIYLFFFSKVQVVLSTFIYNRETKKSKENKIYTQTIQN